MNYQRKLFGTDGIRGRANVHPMTPEVAMRSGMAVAAHFGREGKVVVGKDTRRSGYMLEMALASGLCALGVDVMLTGPLPTPGVAYLAKSMRADAGVVISASHNPFEDNGFKLFANDGFKLPDEVESHIEALMEPGAVDNRLVHGESIGKAFRLEDAGGRYITHVKHVLPQEYELDGLRVVVDCANGAAYKVAPKIFEELGADVVRIGGEPDGTNINTGVGAMHPEHLSHAVREYRADVGLALDGDGDRAVVCDHRGRIIDGDVLLAIIGRDLAARRALSGNLVVATVMSNIGLERSLAQVGVSLVRTPVGDRYVVEAMRERGSNLGGEQSGHIICLDHSTTGDGLVTGLKLLSVMVREQRPLAELAEVMTRYPQVSRNYAVLRKVPLEQLPKTQTAIAAVERQLADEGRVLVRYSGTEALLRVMVEGTDERMLGQVADEIAEDRDRPDRCVPVSSTGLVYDMGTLAPAQLWTAELATAADRYTIEVLGMPSPVLMERAALCVCTQVEALAQLRSAACVQVLVGPGNNGGDGLAVARLLHGRGYTVRAVLVSARHNDAVARQLVLARAHGVEVVDSLPDPLALPTGPLGPLIIVDALLGTGSRGAPRGAIADALVWLGELDRRHVGVVAVDLPSGIDVDSGAVSGIVATADVTVTFQHSKPGLHLTPAREHVGQLVVADIGLRTGELCGPPLELIDPRELARRLAALPTAEHKGRRGHVGVIGGTGGTPGAAILAAIAALRAGAGLATLAPLDPGLRELLVARRPELMLAPPEHAWTIPNADVLVVGPGLVSSDPQALERLRHDDARKMVWDASGLDHYERSPMSEHHVLTPHPGEAARLLARVEPERGWDGGAVQANRRAAAERLAAVTGAIVVLKGAGTVVAVDEPTGRRLAICTTGGPALAAAGTGDVLAGTIGALLGRGLDPWAAACAGVHVHGLAGDRLPMNGTLALDVADSLVQALEQLDSVPARWPRFIRG